MGNSSLSSYRGRRAYLPSAASTLLPSRILRLHIEINRLARRQRPAPVPTLHRRLTIHEPVDFGKNPLESGFHAGGIQGRSLNESEIVLFGELLYIGPLQNR